MATDPAAPILGKIRDEIAGGLPNERGRLDDALYNWEFYRGDFRRFPVRTPGTSYDSLRFQRHSLLMQRVVKTLAAHLYKAGPTRALPDHPEASGWLDAIYRANAVDALFQEADRQAAVGDFCGFQACGAADPDKPVEILLWRAHELVVWVDPDNQLKPVAVATLDLFDNQRRLRRWTATDVETWLTDKWNPGEPNAATKYTFRERRPNPYGVLPFAFVHFEFPTACFHSDGPGTNLRDVNDTVNFMLTETFDGIRYNLRPVVVGKNVRVGWRPPSPIRPGDYWDVPGAGDEAGEVEKDPDVGYLQADSSFVAASWDDNAQFLDHTLEMHGVPPGSIRMQMDGSPSGYSLVVQQSPLIEWARSRQRPFGYYEQALAKLVLAVGASHLGRQTFGEYVATAAKLGAAAAAPGLTLRWPTMYPDIPGEDRDRGDQWALDNGLTSRTALLMRREGMTREEAEAHLEEIAKDRKREAELLGDADPAAGDADSGQSLDDDPESTLKGKGDDGEQN